LEGAEVLRRFEESLEIFRDRGEAVAEGKALTRVGSQLGALGDMARSRDLLAEAVELLERQPPGPELARAYAFRAEERMFAGRNDEAAAYAGRALDLPGGNGEIAIIALHIRGDARLAEGDERGMDDLEEALRIAQRGGDAGGIATSENYLGDWEWIKKGAAAGLEHYLAALEITQRRGLVVASLWAKGGSLGPLFDLGEWDRALQVAEEMLSVGSDRLDGSLEALARIARSRILVLRGRLEDAEAPEQLLTSARPVEELQVVAPALVAAARISFARGDTASTTAYLKEFEEATRDVASQYRESYLAEATRLCIATGMRSLAERLLAASRGTVLRDRLNVLSANALIAEATEDVAEAASSFTEAAAGWRVFGNPLEEAEALLGAARCSVDGEPERSRADSLLAGLGVPPPS
jgi:tetratricopeptide (TPR) repeat protein